MNLGENIHTYRTQQNLSQGELANALDVSRQSVSKWENNGALPELDKIIKMSRLFGITLDELVYGPEAVQKTNEAAATPHHSFLPPARVLIGGILLVFGMIFFLLSIFWGDHLAIGEEAGELISLGVVVLAVALFGTFNAKALSTCAVIYFLYAITCIGIVKVVDVQNYLFMFYSSFVLLFWFFKWGTNAQAQLQEQP